MISKSKATNLDAYVVSVLQSPYTQETFALDEAESFQKHLRTEERAANEKRRAEAATALRMDYWSNLRRSANSVSDILEVISHMPKRMNAYYVSRSSSSDKEPWYLEPSQEILDNLPITHSAPLGHSTNWCNYNKELPTSKIGIFVKLTNNPNSVYSDYKHESGISTGMRTLELFADDWAFVAREALWGRLEGRLLTPLQYTAAEGKKKKPTVSINFTTFTNDVQRYALQLCGVEWSTLKSIYDSGVCSRESFVHMIKAHTSKTSIGPLDSLALPGGMGDDFEVKVQ